MTATQPPAPRPGPGPARHAASTGELGAFPIGSPARPEEPTLGKLVSDATTHASKLVHSEIELAKLELRSTVKTAGTGAVFFLAAAVVAVLSLVYGFQALAEGIAQLGLDRWLAFLIVFVFQLLVAGLFVFLGIKKIKKVKGPQKTISTTKETVDYLKKSRG